MNRLNEKEIEAFLGVWEPCFFDMDSFEIWAFWRSLIAAIRRP